MWKWNIDIYLKGCNEPRRCVYTGPETNSGDVMIKLFQGKNPYDWVDLCSADKEAVTYVAVGEIASIDIYERKDKK